MAVASNLIFKAIADPTRREIFHLLVLASKALSINQISEEFAMTRQGITKHLGILKQAGLVHIKTKGRERYCEADPQPLSAVKDWVGFYEKFWDNKLQSLEKHLEQKAKKRKDN